MKQCDSYLLTLRKLMIQLGGKSCIIVSLSLVFHEINKANKNLYE